MKTLNSPFWVLRSIDILSRKDIIFHHIHSIRFHHHSGPTSSHANGIHLVWLVRFRDWLEEKPFVEDRSKGFVFFSLIPSPPLFCRVRVAFCCSYYCEMDDTMRHFSLPMSVTELTGVNFWIERKVQLMKNFMIIR